MAGWGLELVVVLQAMAHWLSKGVAARRKHSWRPPWHLHFGDGALPFSGCRPDGWAASRAGLRSAAQFRAIHRIFQGRTRMPVLLFFDDWSLLHHRNIQRRWFQAEPWPDLPPATDPSLGYSFGSPTVIREPDGRWRMWAMGIGGAAVSDQHAGTFLYRSSDGLHWEPDPQGALPGQPSHLVFKGEHSSCGAMPFRDAREPDPNRRYKLAYSDTHAAVNGNCGTCKIATSPDGVRWTIDHQAVWQTQHTDTYFSISWNPFTGKYQFTGRPVLLDRRVALYQTADWRTFEPAQVILHPDPQDPALTEFYGMPHFYYHGYYLGLLWRMWGEPRDLYGPIRMAGKVDCELTYSVNGLSWNRTNRQSFLPATELRWRSEYPTSMVQDDQGWLRFYTSSSAGEHADHKRLPTGTPPCQLTVSRLRPDGFCALEARTGEGLVTTRNFVAHGGPITINAQTATCGAVRVEVRGLDDAAIPGYELANCVPVTGDQPRAKLRWVKDGVTRESTDELRGKLIRLHFALDEARLYAVRLSGDLLFGCIPAYNLAGQFLPNQIY